MNKQDQIAIENLFRHLNQTAREAGPRDAKAEAFIQRQVKQGEPGLLYHMAQTLVAQQHAIQQLRAQADGRPAGFAQPGYRDPGYAQPSGYGDPGYGSGYSRGGWRRDGDGGGFLAGAGKIALGVGGGILGAEVLTSIFDGAGGLFGGGESERELGFEQGYDQGFAAGDDYGDAGDYDQDPGGFDDGAFNDGGFDDPGIADGGGFGDGIF